MPTANQLIKISRKKKWKYSRSFKAFKGAPQRRGIIYQITVITPRKPNSAKRKVAKVRLCFNNKRIFTKIPGQGHSLYEHALVMVRGGGAKDTPGVNFTLIRGKLDFDTVEHIVRKRRRSKYGLSTKKISKITLDSRW